MSLKCDNTEFTKKLTKKPNKTICAWCKFLEEHFCLTKPHRFLSFILIGSLYPPPYPQHWGGFLKCKKNLKNQRDHKLTDILKAVNHNWTLSICTYMCTVKLFLRPWCYHKGNFTCLSHPWLTTWSNVWLLKKIIRSSVSSFSFACLLFHNMFLTFLCSPCIFLLPHSLQMRCLAISLWFSVVHE